MSDRSEKRTKEHCGAYVHHAAHEWSGWASWTGDLHLCYCPGTTRREAADKLTVWREADPRKRQPRGETGQP